MIRHELHSARENPGRCHVPAREAVRSRTHSCASAWAAGLCFLVCLPVACRGSGSGAGQVESALAQSSAAQAEFQRLRARFFALPSRERASLAGALRDFALRYPKDELASIANGLLALSLAEGGEASQARAVVLRMRARPGVVRDLSVMVDARILLSEGAANHALVLLTTLSGKVVDPDERTLFGELYLNAAVAAARWTTAASAAQELLAEAPPEARDMTREIARGLLSRAPKAGLVECLRALERERLDHGSGSVLTAARAWLEKVVRERLVALAQEDNDRALARHLLETAPADFRASEAFMKLSRIASGGQSSPPAVGRALGLVLALRDADSRRRSVSIAAGMARALGLPEADSNPETVHLISHDDAGTAEGMDRALVELAAEGASILVAGMDAEGAERATRFAEQSAIPVMLVEWPEHLPVASRFTFLLGPNRLDEQGLLVAELGRRQLERAVRVGTGGVACASDPTKAPFSVDSWRREQASAVLLRGDAACAKHVIVELARARFAPVIGFGLECSELLVTGEAPAMSFGIGSGRFPSAERPAGGQTLLAESVPPLDFYEALGHDAAALARVALKSFPLQRVADARQVSEFHARAALSLMNADAELWTTNFRGFGAAFVLPRWLEIRLPRAPLSVEP
jgi:hypothetical protein